MLLSDDDSDDLLREGETEEELEVLVVAGKM